MISPLRHQLLPALLAGWMLAVIGCAGTRITDSGISDSPLPNPLEIPVDNHEFVWNELVNTVDDYFPIAREQRVRLIGNVLTEGRIETKPVFGATAFEFFRRDATPGFERWHGTLQSIRRRAELRVLPGSTGYGINVVVRKELEDVTRPELASVGSVVQRHDGTLVRPRQRQVTSPKTLGWIPIGRDVALEQKILADIHARFNQVPAPEPVQIMHDQPPLATP